MMAHHEIKGDLVTLRLLSKDHFADYAHMFSPTVRHALQVPTVDNELTYLHERLSKVRQGSTLFYCVFDNSQNKLIGAIEIRDQAHYPGQLYCWLNEQFWGGGRYQEALHLAARTYFQSTQERFFTARVDITNQRSYQALRKCGFAQDGFCNGPRGKQYRLILRKKM